MAAIRPRGKLSHLWSRSRLHGILRYFLLNQAWIIYDIGETQTTKMDEDLAKEFFTFSDSDLKESAIRAKQKETERKEKRLQKFRESSLKRM